MKKFNQLNEENNFTKIINLNNLKELNEKNSSKKIEIKNFKANENLKKIIDTKINQTIIFNKNFTQFTNNSLILVKNPIKNNTNQTESLNK